MRVRVPSVLLFAAILSGCPSEGGDPELPPDNHAWFDGTVVATKPDGEPLGDPAQSLWRRSVLPTVDRIEEQIVELEVGGDPLETIATATVVAEDSTFRVSYQDAYGLLEGNGLLTGGDDWQWTSWESTVVYQTGEREGTTIMVEAEIVDGQLLADTQIVDGDGDLTTLLRTELESISESTWQARYAELIGGR